MTASPGPVLCSVTLALWSSAAVQPFVRTKFTCSPGKTEGVRLGWRPGLLPRRDKEAGPSAKGGSLHRGVLPFSIIISVSWQPSPTLQVVCSAVHWRGSFDICCTACSVPCWHFRDSAARKKRAGPFQYGTSLTGSSTCTRPEPSLLLLKAGSLGAGHTRPMPFSLRF